MRAFRRVPEGLACGLDDWERELLARLALEVRALLQADAPQGVGQSETSSPSPPDPVRPGESERDRKVLEALDFDLDAPTNHVHPGRPSADPVIAVLLPQASEDPITSMEVSSLTRARLRGDKVDRLARLAAELRAPSGPEGTVLVTPAGWGRAMISGSCWPSVWASSRLRTPSAFTQPPSRRSPRRRPLASSGTGGRRSSTTWSPGGRNHWYPRCSGAQGPHSLAV